jgi:hypothetical protein
MQRLRHQLWLLRFSEIDMLLFDWIRERLGPIRRLVATLVIIFGPLYAIYEYETNKQQWRVEKALSIVSNLFVGNLSTSYSKLNIMDQEITEKTSALTDANQRPEVIYNIAKGEKYIAEVEQIVGFYDFAFACIKEGVCD